MLQLSAKQREYITKILTNEHIKESCGKKGNPKVKRPEGYRKDRFTRAAMKKFLGDNYGSLDEVADDFISDFFLLSAYFWKDSFIWDQVPGKDTKKFIKFLKNVDFDDQPICTDRTSPSRIKKIDENTIKIIAENRTVFIKLIKENPNARLEIDNQLVCNVFLSVVNGKTIITGKYALFILIRSLIKKYGIENVKTAINSNSNTLNI